MISNNKILTVSYGTFSCTLEGFDDSFGTMKAIAEYFRDLASEDRYFGAEPPQPDAEMLQRIAEREISRRVEARSHEGKIFLSASEPDAAAPESALSDNVAADDDASAIEAAAIADAAEQAEAAAAEQAEADRAANAAREAQAEMDRVEAEAEAKEKADAAQATRLAEAAQAAEDEVEDAVEDVEEPDLSALIAHAEATHTKRTPRDLGAELPEAEAFFAGDTQHAEVSDDATTTPVQSGKPGDSIAAKLDRIRAVVSQADSIADDDDGYSEDEHAEDYSPRAKDIVDVDHGDMNDTDDDDDDDDTITANALADIEAALAADDIADADAPQVKAVVQAPEQDDDDVASILAALDADDDEDDTDGVQDNAASAANLFDDTQDSDDVEAKSDAATEEEPAPRRMARVIKVKRADLEAAIAQGDLEEVDDDGFDEESSLSDDDEAELARELAEVSSEIEPQSDLGDLSAYAMPGVDVLTPIGENTGDDVSRLMAEADAHMGEEEGAQRRDAFAHLRAAVAAKKAETDLGEVDPEQEKVAYRDDLATVVKPRRPATESGRSVRPETTRPAPLKLVAEQRVDASVEASSGPVRPRRVAAVKEAAHSGDDAGSFAEFADDMGATNLSDLLEAAAAYMSFVEGREQFSRPQLMTKVRQVEKDDFSREDGLRSFGKLLRAGKIEKLKGGRFTVTGDIGFRPDARAAG